MEGWREWLYSLGYLSSIAFTARFLIQWVQSEKAGRSVVTPTFWNLSLIGNGLTVFHALIQLQYHLFIVQLINGCIAWRNLNLMNEKPMLFRPFSQLFAGCILVGTALFALSVEGGSWFRTPLHFWQQEVQSLSLGWHLLGALGIFLFSARFWFQWWDAEKARESYLPEVFWWLSVAGGALSLVYFIVLRDPVNIVGPAFGLIPYIRNLILIRRET